MAHAQEYRNPIIFARTHFDERTDQPTHHGKLWIMEEDGSGLRQLTFGATYDEHPALLSDRRYGLYSEFRSTTFDVKGGGRLIKIDIYTGEKEVYAESPGCTLHHITISPIDDILVYQHDCGRRLSQRVGWPDGYESQVNATARDWKRTGSLYNFVDIKEQLVQPDTWYTQHIIAKGNHIVTKINGKTVVDHVDEKNTHTRGHLALQQHDPGTTVHYRNLQMKPIP